MLIIPGMKMKVSGNLTHAHYNRTTVILVAAQTWRLVGVAFLWGMAQGILAPAFALPAGIGDIAVGVTAIPLVLFLRKGYSWSKYVITVWSVLGIADLVMAVSLGAIIFESGSSTMATFPWVLIPAAAVPATLALHVITLYRLRKWVPKQEAARLG